MQQKTKILQIIPGGGWMARHGPLEGESGTDRYEKVVCFALVQIIDEDGEQTEDVFPMEAWDRYVDFCKYDHHHFLGVCHESDVPVGSADAPDLGVGGAR